MTTPKDRPDISPIEVITSVQRRRRWSPEEKRAILEDDYGHLGCLPVERVREAGKCSAPALSEGRG
jgi:hypothetical protein